MKYHKKPKASPIRSKEWMTRRYKIQKKSAQEIATETGESIIQVYRYLDKFGLREK